MDYKEKYEKAVKAAMLAKQDTESAVTIGILEEIFPELKESEDERIKKALITYFSDEDESYDGIPYPSILAWLERQGEQKPADKVEPKSLDEAIEHCKEKSCGNNACALEHKQLKEWLTELKELRGHKPSEWSEEDESVTSLILAICNDYKESFKISPASSDVVQADIDRVDNWLKSLKDRVQPKQEWSEEDEKFVHGLIRGLSAKRDIHGHTTFSSDGIDITKTIDWLKSLRPQSHWKPSDEQIKVCKEVYADILSAKGFDLGTVNSELNRLEEQLKKQ